VFPLAPKFNAVKATGYDDDAGGGGCPLRHERASFEMQRDVEGKFDAACRP